MEYLGLKSSTRRSDFEAGLYLEVSSFKFQVWEFLVEAKRKLKRNGSLSVAEVSSSEEELDYDQKTAKVV